MRAQGRGPTHPHCAGPLGDDEDAHQQATTTVVDEQLHLFGAATTSTADETPAKEDLDAKFHRDRRERPEVYEELKRLALQAVRAGRRRLGIQMLAEVARWNSMFITADGEPYKINNSLLSRYARALMANESELAGVFEVRALHSDSTLEGGR